MQAALDRFELCGKKNNNEIGTVDNDVARSKNTLSIPWRTAWYAARRTVGVPRLTLGIQGHPSHLGASLVGPTRPCSSHQGRMALRYVRGSGPNR